MDEEDYEDKLHEFMENHHNSAIEEFTAILKESSKKTEYLDAAKKLLARKNNREALKILREAVEEYSRRPAHCILLRMPHSHC